MRRSQGFEHVSAPVARLKAKIERAIVDRDESAASEAHEDLTAAEHEQRLIETVRKYAK